MLVFGADAAEPADVWNYTRVMLAKTFGQSPPEVDTWSQDEVMRLCAVLNGIAKVENERR